MADLGRPTTYSRELLLLRIYHRIAEGESVRSIVKDEDIPSSSTIFRWLLDEDKKDSIKRAISKLDIALSMNSRGHTSKILFG
jgi:hypothetical protein